MGTVQYSDWLSVGEVQAIAQAAGVSALQQPASLPRSSRLDDGTLPRSWDAADITEENAHQWIFADGRTINEVLVDHRLDIIRRSTHEARRNPTVEGVIKSHAGDVVGDEGPGLQMLTDDDRWNDLAEAIWKEYAESVDGSGQLSLGEWLRQDVYQSWVSGDMIAQVIAVNTPFIRTRVHPINAIRLRSPYTGRLKDVFLGIRRDKFNKPTHYYFEDEIRDEHDYKSHIITEVPARDIMHYFELLEPGQVCGWPRLASCLQAVSDLREYDNAVLDAAKVQAMMAVLMYTTDNMVDPKETVADVRLKRMGVTRLPMGWQAQSLVSSQPNNNNTDFRNERIRELGRAAGMPLMQIRLDSSGHNYSSARFDAQTYHKINKLLQGSLGRHRVKPLIRLVLSEAMMLGILPPRPITLAEINLRWPNPPHVDPVKEAMAERIRLENKTLSPQQACSAHNIDFETLAREWARANAILEANGLPPMIGPIPTNLQQLQQFLAPETEGNTNEQQSTSEEDDA